MKLLNKYFYILKKIDKRITFLATDNNYFTNASLLIGYNVFLKSSNIKTIFWICFYEKGKIYKHNGNNGKKYSNMINMTSIEKSYFFPDIKFFILSLKQDGYEII